ncbi:efflux RND transporter permease subunit, partial [bacterium]|nr:efflux RND transporter permease subunit [bacterium]
VFLPIAFVPGIVGQIFFSMSLAIVFSLAASYIVAVILVPMLSSRILKIHKKPNEFIINIIKAIYRFVLKILLCHWTVSLVYFLSVMYLLYFSFSYLPAMSFFPDMDRRSFIVKYETPEGTSVDETDKVTKRIEEILKTFPEVDKITSNSQMGEGSVTIALFPLEKATLLITIAEYLGFKKKSTAKSTDEIIKSVRPFMKKVPGYSRIEYSKPKMGGPGGGKPVQIEVSGADIKEIEKICIMITEKISGVKGLKELESGVKTGRPEIKINFDREKLRDLDQDLGEVAGMVRSYVFGSLAGKYKESNEEYDIRVEIDDIYKNEIRKLANLELILGKNKVVTLSQIATVFETKGYTKIKRKNLKRLIMVQADLENRPIGAVTKDIDKILKTLKLPSGYSYKFGGEEEERAESFGNLGIALFASVILVYMIMASQFESFAYPFVIMFTIPLSIIGVILSLNIYGFPFSITAMIGIIMLAGIVVNNGILLIDYTNQRREELGESNKEAALQAGCVRLRPILMTTLTTVLGMLPLSL